MAYIANILLGRISKTHGFEGAVTVKLDKGFIEKIPDMESVFLEIEGKPVPFFIEESEYPGGDILRLKFSGYNNIEKVNEFTGCRILLNSENEDSPGTAINYNVEGYKIFLPENTLLGTIRSVIENPGQLLLSVVTESGREILIPFHEHFILGIDKKRNIIKMNLPEGLTEIN